MAQVKHLGVVAAEVDDSLVEKLLATGQWELAGDPKPAPVKRTRRAAAKPVEAPATEE